MKSLFSTKTKMKCFVFLVIVGSFCFSIVSGQELKNNSCNVNFYLDNNDTRPILSATSNMPAITADLILNQNHLKRSSLLYNMVSIASDVTANENCLRELREIKRGIDERQIWAMKGIFNFC